MFKTYDELASLLDANKDQLVDLGEGDKGILKTYRLFPMTANNKKGVVKAILWFRTINTYKVLTFVFPKDEASSSTYEICGSFKEAKCLLTEDVAEALRHLRYKNVVRCMKHHNDHWIVQLDGDDKLIHHRYGRFSVNSRRKKDTVTSLATDLKPGFSLQHAHDCFMTIIIDKERTKLFLDYFHFDKRSGEYQGISCKSFNNPTPEMIKVCKGDSVIIDEETVHEAR